MDVITAALGLVLFWLGLELWRKRRSASKTTDSRRPPIASPENFSPVFGHLPYLLKFNPSESYASKGVENLTRLSTDPVVLIYPGPPLLVRPLYMVRDLRLGKVLAGRGAQQQKLGQTVQRVVGGPTFVYGLSTKETKRHRRIVAASVLRHEKLARLAALAGKHADRYLDSLHCSTSDDGAGTEPQTRREPVAVKDAIGSFSRLTLSVMTEMLIGLDMYDDAAMSPCQRQEHFSSMVVVLGFFMQMYNSVLPVRLFTVVRPFLYATFRYHISLIYKNVITPAIRGRLAAIEEGEDAGDDALASMLDDASAGRGETGLSEEEAQLEIMTLMITSDTSPAGILWILFYLSQNPEVQEKCYQEIVSVIGTEPSADRPTLADLERLPYLSAVVKETNRLDPIGPGLARDAKEDLEIGDYTIPKGSTGLFFYYLWQNSEAVYERAAEFRPERWLGSPAAGGATCDGDSLPYAPFGYGQHRCFGQSVGLVMVRVVACKIIHAYRIGLLSRPEDAWRSQPIFSSIPHKLVPQLIPRS